MKKAKKIVAAAVIGVVVMAGSIGVLANPSHSFSTTGTRFSGSLDIASSISTSRLDAYGQATVRMEAIRPDGTRVYDKSLGTQLMSNPEVKLSANYQNGTGVRRVAGTHTFTSSTGTFTRFSEYK